MIGLIKDWKKCPKFASVRWSFLGMVLMGIAEFGQNLMFFMPMELREQLPSTTVIAMILFGLAIIGRILKLETKDGNEQNG